MIRRGLSLCKLFDARFCGLFGVSPQLRQRHERVLSLGDAGILDNYQFARSGLMRQITCNFLRQIICKVIVVCHFE